jgi:hypothetical protein
MEMKTHRYGRIIILALGCLVGWLCLRNQQSDFKLNIEVSGFSKGPIIDRADVNSTSKTSAPRDTASFKDSKNRVLFP